MRRFYLLYWRINSDMRWQHCMSLCVSIFFAFYIVISFCFHFSFNKFPQTVKMTMDTFYQNYWTFRRVWANRHGKKNFYSLQRCISMWYCYYFFSWSLFSTHLLLFHRLFFLNKFPRIKKMTIDTFSQYYFYLFW